MPKPRGAWVFFTLTPEQAETLRLVLAAVIEAGADPKRIDPVRRQLRAAVRRQQASLDSRTNVVSLRRRRTAT